MLAFADVLRSHLIAFLASTGIALGGVLLFLVVRRAADGLRFRREQRAIAGLRPLLDPLLRPDATDAAFGAFARRARRHPDIAARLLLASLARATGPLAAHLQRAARDAGLLSRWRTELRSGHWRVRADAARGLGLAGDERAFLNVIQLLDDAREEVRAAAIDALGAIGDDRAVGPLLERLGDETRHQRARVVEALRRLGPAVAPALVSHAEEHTQHLAAAAELLGVVGTCADVDALLRWSRHGSDAVRAAAVQSIGPIGVDDRTYYHVLKALGDPAPAVRAMAARALGRSHRPEAARDLGARMADEWLVAAHCATALRTLGPAGLAQLAAHRDDEGAAGELARQMLLEQDAAPVEALSA